MPNEAQGIYREANGKLREMQRFLNNVIVGPPRAQYVHSISRLAAMRLRNLYADNPQAVYGAVLAWRDVFERRWYTNELRSVTRVLVAWANRDRLACIRRKERWLRDYSETRSLHSFAQYMQALYSAQAAEEFYHTVKEMHEATKGDAA